VALSPKTARTLNKKKKKTSCAAVYTELYRMFACIRRRQIIAANEKFGFQPHAHIVTYYFRFRKGYLRDCNSVWKIYRCSVNFMLYN